MSDDLTTRLRATFIGELEDQVRQMNADLLALETAPEDADLLRSLFRSSHSVKGAARVAAVPLVEQACHSIESFFSAVRDGAREFDGEAFPVLFAAADALGEAGARLRADRSLEGSALERLMPAIEALSAGEALPPVPARKAKPAAPASGPTPPAEPGRTRVTTDTAGDAADTLVRIQAEKLDALLTSAGDLLVARGRLTERAHEIEELRGSIARVAREWRRQSVGMRVTLKSAEAPLMLVRAVDAIEEGLSRVAREATVVAQEVTIDSHAVTRISNEVGATVRGLRLRPFREACEQLPRAARDVAAADGKDVQLDLEGQDVEVDRTVIDALRDPLLHLVRNAVDHGVEKPDARAAAGKPRQARVRVAATLQNGRLVVTVSDDGRGIDGTQLRRQMLRLGRVVEAGNEGLVRALLGGGVSTRREATAISGRGVGLDVVRTALDRIRGSVDVAWRPGAGTTFTLECPPTPAIVRALLVGIGGQVLAIPSAGVDRLLRVRPESIRHAEGRAVLIAEGGPFPIVPLAAILGPPLTVKPLTATSPVVLLVVGERRLAVTVDELIGEDEVVAQPLGTDDEAHPLVNGGAILPSGRVALVLNIPGLIEGGTHAEGVEVPSQDGPTRPGIRILVVDDSITTRTLEQSVLEAAGYDVLTAVDGQDAWRRLQELGADLVVADVEMPRMDGFTLCERIRATQRFRDLPVVLVTALESEEYRARGLDVGADAYVFKSAFEQETLLETISELLGRPD